MLYSKAEWKITRIDEDQVQRIAEQTGLSHIAARFLVQRGMTTKETIDAFLHMNDEALLDPYRLKDMDKTVTRIKKAIDHGERILIFGDYDADGVTSTSLLYLTLREMGAEVGFYVPNRFTEGYGPNENAFRQAADENVSLIVTVDTGIAAVHEAKVAKELGVDLIITDHHEPPPELPDAFAVINPKQPTCSYENKHLAGVGVAFKVAHALLGRVPEEFYDLVAIGTIADLVTLQGENRYLAMKGIQSLTRSQRPGLKALLERAGSTQQEINEEQVGFLIGPRLNAAGRLDSADPAVELLITEDLIEADELAQMIDDLNKERQKIVKDITKEAEAMVEEAGIPPVIVVGREGWNPGVIGIVASRLVEKFYRPTIVLSYDSEKGQAKGSARSIEGFDMFASLSQCREWLPHFGGHTMAAGLTMDLSHVDMLREKLSDMAVSTLTEKEWQKSLDIDLPISLNEVSLQAISDLQQMSPFGMGNPAPVFLIENVHLHTIKKIGANEDHLKLTVADNEREHQLDCIGFRMGSVHDHISPLSKVSAVGKLAVNEWNGQSKPQFIIDDIKVSNWQLFDFRGDKRIWQNKVLMALEECTVIVFRSYPDHLPELPASWEVIQMNKVSEQEAKEKVAIAKHLLLMDLPDSVTKFEHVMFHARALENVYVAFLHDKDHFFETIPTREHFKWLYALLLKRKTFDLQRKGKELAKYKGWTEEAVHFMCQVFFELEFVKINKGVVELTDQPVKKDLAESPTYQKRIEENKIEKELYYSSLSSLKEVMDMARKGNQLTSV
ncbi:single-stranded-DNA-specific exonuclease RecJ [Salipaludibacillus agaradhaerens]|uniref:Single-stranded-DNA-specific exonuclease RecJ n=1 Tax=Salipaludibacillus agaradhaerens TaxID=76935 RepID=A0A9Q4B255_SALAG|nr:single-stranded-DNA-specific exonuclease RecJ [Salipaludibacillus agaradhaerens]MCR6096973.1 single-stranded-DNA-specific exonuclease RecJ [Salipaludibacillus agaradhaerens]MCR6113542.1 single-stranded-DNA-specific exonuclease RecJ [Salipaludibacillus agaradhaerens]